MIVEGVLRPDQEKRGYHVEERDEDSTFVMRGGKVVIRFYSTNGAMNPNRIQGLVDQMIALEEN